MKPLIDVCGISAVIWLVLLSTGCSTVVNSHLQKEPVMAAYCGGRGGEALQVVEERLDDSSWFDTSVVGTGDELVWRLEAGSLNFVMGRWRESLEQFRLAETLITGYDERARISLRDVGAETGSALTNPNALPYRGWCRDRMALAVYKSLAYLGMGKEDAFRAQLRRLRAEQKKVQDEYREFFEQQKAELAAAKRQDRSTVERAEKSATEDKMIGDDRNTEFASGLQDVRRIAHKGYGGFLNPLAIFLSGLGSVRDGNFDNARIDFRRLYAAMPGNPMVRKYYVSALARSGRPFPAGLQNETPFPFPLDRDCVYVIAAHGRGAALRQISVYFPIMTAWPMCEFYDAPFTRISAAAGGAEYETLPISDMDGILAQEFEERLPMMIVRIAVGTALKEAAKYAATYAAAQENELLGAGVFLAASLYTAAVNTADTRCWESLPKEFLLTQFPMPADRRVVIALTGPRGNLERTVTLPDRCRSAILFVNAPSPHNVAVQILPFSSK
ncbi:MAG: hypothetical protein MR051_04030 [Lentisphaeria bacterium]|nr:hypothetical protein [Lentisphaeria bacterium]